VLGWCAADAHREPVENLPEILVSSQQPSAAAAPSLSTLQVIQSVAWAFFGVQSHRNRVRDFTSGRPLHFIAVGLLLTGAVVGLFVAAAQLALKFL